jgi:hypothetical protein
MAVFYIVRANDSVGNFRDNHLAISNFQHGSNKGFVLEENITQHFLMGSFSILQSFYIMYIYVLLSHSSYPYENNIYSPERPFMHFPVCC